MPTQKTYRSLQQNKGKKSENSVVKRSHALASYLLQTVQLTQQLCANKKIHNCYNKDYATVMLLLELRLSQNGVQLPIY